MNACPVGVENGSRLKLCSLSSFLNTDLSDLSDSLLCGGGLSGISEISKIRIQNDLFISSCSYDN